MSIRLKKQSNFIVIWHHIYCIELRNCTLFLIYPVFVKFGIVMQFITGLG